MIKQMTQAIVGLLGIYFLIEAISNLARSTYGVSYAATVFDKLLIFQQPIIQSLALLAIMVLANLVIGGLWRMVAVFIFNIYNPVK